jgi:hypothetical protein
MEDVLICPLYPVTSFSKSEIDETFLLVNNNLIMRILKTLVSSGLLYGSRTPHAVLGEAWEACEPVTAREDNSYGIDKPIQLVQSAKSAAPTYSGKERPEYGTLAEYIDEQLLTFNMHTFVGTCWNSLREAGARVRPIPYLLRPSSDARVVIEKKKFTSAERVVDISDRWALALLLGALTVGLLGGTLITTLQYRAELNAIGRLVVMGQAN